MFICVKLYAKVRARVRKWWLLLGCCSRYNCLDYMINSRMTPKLKNHTWSPLLFNKNCRKESSLPNPDAPVCVICISQNCFSIFLLGFVRWSDHRLCSFCSIWVHFCWLEQQRNQLLCLDAFPFYYRKWGAKYLQHWTCTFGSVGKCYGKNLKFHHSHWRTYSDSIFFWQISL